MKIAVIGAGFSGLACAWFLSDKASITLVDKTAIGAGASGLTAGLLHAYHGPKAVKSWKADEAMPEAIALLDIASKALGKKVYAQNGILRPEIAGMDFSKAQEYNDVEYWDALTCQKHISELAANPGIFIKSGCTVNCPEYIQGLWLACQQKGVTLSIQEITTPKQLSGYDAIIFTVGAGQNALKEVNHPPISLIKGQTLELEWPYNTPLPFAINAAVQVAQIDPKTIWAGATYERKWTIDGPDKKAELEIRTKLKSISEPFSTLPLIRTWTSFRAATGDKKPFISHTAPNIYSLGGMGSKGLLYHAYMAKQLSLSLI
ncbi:MAG: FAD-binding oxidoreductase [Chlamydiales bacterium]|nr:FAD-binding oxidoreductase [Chlamydiales bacterium]